MSAKVKPITPEGTLPCSIPMRDADLSLGNANWSKGLQAMSDWIWSANLNPVAFPNNLGRYFLQIPAIFEQQLSFSTSLIFDESSFRNGIQVSGFIDRPIRELVINLIAQRRRASYTMTHHVVLGTLTARKHGILDAVFANKLVCLTDHEKFPQVFTPLELEILKFADAFATNPKTWTDADCANLKSALRDENSRRYAANGLWMDQLNAARAAYRQAMATGNEAKAGTASAEAAVNVSGNLPTDINDRMVNAELVELACLCLQFVALADVFSSLNIPDESFLPDVLMSVVRPEVIARINEINAQDVQNLSNLVPPIVSLPVRDIAAGQLQVAPASLKGSRIPLVSYEIDQSQATRDKGLAVGGAQIGVWGWSFGSYFPGGLVYMLMHHPELARFEAPYSLPLLFNEDEWRNGTQTGGFVTRRLKEIVFLKIYTTTRSRYGLEHHTMFLFNIFLDEYGVGLPPTPPLAESEKIVARQRALQHAEDVVLYVNDLDEAPAGTFTDVERATIAWVQRIITRPHSAHELEPTLREKLDAENRRQVSDQVRRLDDSPGIGTEAAYARLLDHQIAELSMLTGHMDGLGRAMTMLRLESEVAVTTKDGYMTDRPSLFQAYGFVGVTEKAQTANELRLNPELLEKLKSGEAASPVASATAAQTGEF